MPVRGTVNRSAERYIVSGHRFRDGTGRAAHTEKPARHFLARADRGKRSILLGIQINLESLLVGADPSPGSCGTQDVSISRLLNLANAAAVPKAFGVARI